jgi:hypothetical protein
MDITWIDIEDANNKPPENTDVLVYTDSHKMKVASLRNGIWNTYMKILFWAELPKAPRGLRSKIKGIGV